MKLNSIYSRTPNSQTYGIQVLLESILRDPDRLNNAVAQSIGNCHVIGMNSIIVNVNPHTGSRTRLYVFEPGHQLSNTHDIDDNSLLTHNHGFKFSSHTLVGWIKNIEFQEAEQAPGMTRGFKYEYRSGLMAGKEPELHFIRPAWMHIADMTMVPAGHEYEFTETGYHRIMVPNQLTCVLFNEFEKLNNDQFIFELGNLDNSRIEASQYGVNAKYGLNTKDLYKPLDKAEVKRLIKLTLEKM